MEDDTPISFSNAKPNVLFSLSGRTSKPKNFQIQYLNNRNYYINHANGHKITYRDDFLYNYNNHKVFTIDDFSQNKPVKLYYELTCLTENKDSSMSFESIDDPSSQQFIFLKHDSKPDVYYIKTPSNKFLGSPNRNNIVYSYSSKNKFTEWKVYRIGLNKYMLSYSGEKFNTSKINIVVARYNENINWLIPYNDIAIIINKGNRNIPNFSNVIYINNIGREGHTYLYYIINRYHNLPEQVIFTQGSPFEHNETFLYAIDNYDLLLPIQPLGLQYLKERHIPPEEIVDTYKISTNFGLNYLVLESNGDLLTSFYDYGATNFVSNYKNEYGINYDPSLNLLNNFFINSDLSNNPKIESVKFTYSGLFSVTNSVMVKHPLSFYINLITHLTDKNNQGGVNGYILEKLWLYIFGYNSEETYYPFTGVSNEPDMVDLSNNILSS